MTILRNGKSIINAIIETRKGISNDKKVLIEECEYYLDKPIFLGIEDSGICIEGKGNVRLFGGKPIAGWEKSDDKFWRAKAPGTDSGEWDFRMLIVNNRYAERARYPETGYLLHETEFDVKWLSTYEGGFERKPTYEELTTLQYKKEDIGESFEPKNAEITCFHMWDESLVGVKSIDREKQIITFSNPAGWPPGAFTKYYNFEKRYVVWNTIEGMLKPGQWFLDRKNGEVVYWPLEGETIENLKVIAPVLENVIVAEGTEENPVENISIKNLRISGTNAPLMSGAFGAKLFDGAVSLRFVNNSEISNVEIANVGAHCIKASGDNLKIENCQLHHSGAGAIRYVGSESLIRNNHIHHVGRTFPSAIALYVGATDPNVPEEWIPGQNYRNCTIEHNEIHDAPYAAICAGGKNLKILKNFIYRAMQDLYDGAGIYVTFCDNALIKGNFIKDIKDAPGAGTSAYYLDEKTINAVVEENVEINVPRPSHNHISFNNVFRNNFFIIKGKGYFSMERSGDYTFEKNVVIAEEGFTIYDLKFCPNFRNNVFYTKGELKTKELDHYKVLSEYILDLKDGNTNEDPMLINYQDGKIEMDINSPALKKGIKAIDVSDAGIIKQSKI